MHRNRSGRWSALVLAGLLRRQDGVLRIRLEDESMDPRTLPPPQPRDTAR